MIYELAIVAKTEATEEQRAAVNTMVAEVVSEFKGEVLLTDDWGNKHFAQATSNGIKTGHYLYLVVSGNGDALKEIERRLKNNELILKKIFVKVGDTKEEGEKFAKTFKSPFSKKFNGSIVDDGDADKDLEKDKKRFARRKACWFAANCITPDWKDPKTYGWLINEFGKINPGRVSGISRKSHRLADAAIKRARNMGLVSHITNTFAE
ncbi:30S ribosomal protein S18 [Halobacteriovorax sp. HLS]|uniref:30S ribosomal protein S18 n=1 Tax=Halobacteriovorax sp. HLS TaxID=2234000 RepID=UPI000FD79DE3|nr:30S ribosomal protein S18 [Halobacteriovorax sp. HLS]